MALARVSVGSEGELELGSVGMTPVEGGEDVVALKLDELASGGSV